MRPECSWPRWNSTIAPRGVAGRGRPMAVEELDAVVRAKGLLLDRGVADVSAGGVRCSMSPPPSRDFPCCPTRTMIELCFQGPFALRSEMFRRTKHQTGGVAMTFADQRGRSAAGRRGTCRAWRARLESGGRRARRVVALRGGEADRHLEVARPRCATSARPTIPPSTARSAEGRTLGPLADILANTPRERPRRARNRGCSRRSTCRR